MKKALSLILALVMCLSLCACGGGNDPADTPATEETKSSTTEATAAPTEAVTTTPTETTNMVALGEKLTGDNIEITVKSIEFAALLGKDNTTRVFERDVSWDKPGDGKVYTIIKFEYTNLAKQEVDMVRDVKITVVYKDGYEFASFDEKKAYIFEDNINGVFRQCCLDTGGYVMELSPLTSGSFFIAIPVAEMVSTDTESPIQIKVDYGTNIKGGASVSETVYINVQ